VFFFGLPKQPNHHDCGLFAIANAVCNGQSPEGLNYSTKVMRKHLAGCLEGKVFCHFPASQEVLNRKQKGQALLYMPFA